MPRDGSHIYTQPFDDVDPATTIESTVYNGFTHDVETDLNTARPIIAGGTGATSADGALQNLSGEKAAQLVTNFDSHIWLPGSFRHVASASNVGQPVLDRDFVGVCYINEPLTAAGVAPTNQNVVVEARDQDDTVVPGKIYVREKKAGTWSAWTAEGSIYVLAADVAEPMRRVNVLTPHENLIMRYSTNSAILFTADVLMLFKADGKSKKFLSWNSTCALDIGIGVGGLDAGLRTPSTWYHVWAIAKADGTKNLIFSTSATAPALPTDYLYYGYVGSAYNKAAHTIPRFNQRGNVAFGHWQDIGASLSAGNATSYTAISLSGVIPVTATAVRLRLAIGTSPATTAAITAYIASEGSGTTASYDESFHSGTIYSGDITSNFGEVDIPIHVPQQIKYRVSGTNGNVSIQGVGWRY